MTLVIVIMALSLLTGLGTVLVVGTMTETAVVANYRQGVEAFYAAEGAVEFAIRDLAQASDWDAIVTGATTSTFVDGPPDGTRRVGASTVDLTQATADVNALAAAETEGSFHLYAYGRFADLVSSAAVRSPIYVCVWVADLSAGEEVEAERVVRIIGRAYGPTGAQRSIAVSVARAASSDDPASAPLEVLSWAELR
jgi:Tfp pilus assembly protein PilX